VVKNTRIFQSGEKCEDFSKMVKNTKIFQSGLVVMGDLLRWKMRRFIKVVKNMKIF